MRLLTGWRTAAAVGVLFGALTVAAGTRVLAGVDVPDYVVLPWLVRYNVAAGAVGMAIGVGLWLARPWASAGSALLASAHALVLIALLARRIGGDPVANDSLAAMTLRTVVWSAIAVVVRLAAPRRR